MEPSAIAQWAHDIRNTLGTVSLYLEALERTSEVDTARILARSDALLKKATGMCSDLMSEAAQSARRVPLHIFDVTRTIEEVLGLIAPIVPAETTLSLTSNGPVHVIASQKDIFRVLFNLVHNAVGAARAAGTTRRIKLALEPSGSTVIIRLSDDGPGLPGHIKDRVFRQGRSSSSGHGLSIARELAERNGAILELSDTARGTEFTIEMQRVNSDA